MKRRMRLFEDKLLMLTIGALAFVVVVVGASVWLEVTKEPCWTTEVCEPEREFTYFIKAGDVLVPVTGRTRDCSCPPMPNEVP